MNLRVSFSESQQAFSADFLENELSIKVNLGEVHTVTEYIGGEKYEGEYAVTPKVEAQTLPTKEKVMVDDMTINAIPFFNVSNTSGGSTVYIGKEV